MKYHLSADGEPRVCSAKSGKCPYAATEHFTSPEAARDYYEQKHSSFWRKTKIKHLMSLSDDSKKLLDDLYGEGFDPYVVGGSVRDSYLSGEMPKDVDIEVFGVSDIDTLSKTLRGLGYKVDEVGKSFGVLKTVLKNGDDIDISMPRRDSKVNEGHTGFEVKVDPTLTLEDAAGRRDFTINALYYSSRGGHIIDPYGGIDDFKRNRLRHINEHFGEDPLRVIRGVQFAARFKMELDPETAALSRKLLEEFDSVSPERFQGEFEKMFTKGDAAWGLRALVETGWHEKLRFSGNLSSAGPLVQETVDRAKSLNEDSAVFGAGKLARRIPLAHRSEAIGYFLAGDKRQRKALDLQSLSRPSGIGAVELNAWSRQLWRAKGLTPKDYFIYTGDGKVRDAATAMGIFEKPQPDFITGDMILKMTDKRPGPWVGNVLKKANGAQDNGLFTTPEGAARWLAKWGEKLIADAPNVPVRTVVK